MQTQVVNVKVTHIRPQYRDLKQWCEDPDNVYIGRGGVVFVDNQRYPPASIFANPFKLSDYTRAEALAKYREWLDEKTNDPAFREKLAALKGKRLGCWCHPDPCHGDILVEKIRDMRL